jgi:single-stranded-DNA-specific exonuclease
LSFQGGVYDIVYKLGRNTYKGNTELQLTVQYFLEAGGKPKKAFEGIIADERRTGVSEAVERYKDGILFYEGLKSRCAVQNTVNRFNVPNKPGGSLIFLSVPVNSQIFREVVTTVNPKVIVINFSILPDYSFKGFMTELLGVLKYIINKESGEAKLEQLSMRLCVEEELLVAALKYLKALGKLEFSIDYESNQVYIDKTEKAPCGEAHMLEKNLKDALQEKNAYMRFVREMEIEKFREYLK